MSIYILGDPSSLVAPPHRLDRPDGNDGEERDEEISHLDLKAHVPAGGSAHERRDERADPSVDERDACVVGPKRDVAVDESMRLRNLLHVVGQAAMDGRYSDQICGGDGERGQCCGREQCYKGATCW